MQSDKPLAAREVEQGYENLLRVEHCLVDLVFIPPLIGSTYLKREQKYGLVAIH